jgi:hypothetical protein
MPSWYDAAQQKVVSGATTAANAMPSLQNTVAGQAINTLSGPNNPFQQAQSTLQQISSGAANPWLVSPTGQVTPNTNTALGGLFQAQNQQLQQILPSVAAKETAAGVGSGQFGSLRSETARDKAVADAQANLLTAQMQAALQNQQTGSTAAANLGNVANQGITAESTLGQLQQSDPFAASSALAKVLGGLNVGNTVSSAVQYSPLAQVTSLGGALQGGLGALNATKTGSDLLKGLGLTGLLSSAGGAYSGTTDAAGNVTYPLSGGGNVVMYPNGYEMITDASGKTTYYDPSGNIFDPTGTDVIPAGDMTDLSGGDTGWIDNFDWNSLLG